MAQEIEAEELAGPDLVRQLHFQLLLVRLPVVEEVEKNHLAE
jgi:hypothetical protein